MPNFTRESFARRLAEYQGTTAADARKTVDAVLDILSDVMSEGRKIGFAGFGCFFRTIRKAHTGHSWEGENRDIPETKSVHFRPFTALKERLQ